MMGPKKQDYGRKSKEIKRKIHRWMSVRQMGIILENKVVQTLKLENNVFAKKCFPKLIFLHEKKPFFYIQN